MPMPQHASGSKRPKSSLQIQRNSLDIYRDIKHKRVSCSFDQHDFDFQTSPIEVDLNKSIRNLSYWVVSQKRSIKKETSFQGCNFSMASPTESPQQSIELKDNQRDFRIHFRPVVFSNPKRQSKFLNNASFCSDNDSVTTTDNPAKAPLNPTSKTFFSKPGHVTVTNEIAISETINKEIITSMVAKKIGSALKTHKPKENYMPLIHIEANKIISNFSNLTKSFDIKNLNFNSIAKRIEKEVESKRLENIQADNHRSFFLKKPKLYERMREEKIIQEKLEKLKATVALIKEQKHTIQLEQQRYRSMQPEADRLKLALKKLIKEEVS